METSEIVADILSHHGVKGMKWGIRKDRDVKGLDKFPKEQSDALNLISGKMEKAYGWKIDGFIPVDMTQKKNKNLLAYVATKGDGTNWVHMRNDRKLKSDIISLQKSGWLVPAKGHPLESLISHESAHSLLHTRNVGDKTWFEQRKVKQPVEVIRKDAWKKAQEQAIKDGDVQKGLFKSHPEYQMTKHLSGYAKNSLFIEESEAEMFAYYHWGNPPKFVDVFMNEIHTSMGKEVAPFSGRKAYHA